MSVRIVPLYNKVSGDIKSGGEAQPGARKNSGNFFASQCETAGTGAFPLHKINPDADTRVHFVLLFPVALHAALLYIISMDDVNMHIA